MAAAAAAAEAQQAAAATDVVKAEGAEAGGELDDFEATKQLMNEDTMCPMCKRPFLPYGQGPTEGFVVPKKLGCGHAICGECAKECYTKDVVPLLGKRGVRCPFTTTVQRGRSFVCRFVTPCELDSDGTPVLREATRHRRICRILRETGVLVGKELALGDSYWYRVCSGCGNKATMYCPECALTMCEDCKGCEHDGVVSIDEYTETTVRSHKCACGKQAAKCCDCGGSLHYYCRDRQCFDRCMGKRCCLVEFDPDLNEMKRQETAMGENAKKMFIHEMHHYIEPNPFYWTGFDLDCFYNTVLAIESFKQPPCEEDSDDDL